MVNEKINIVTPAGFGDAFTYSSVIKNKYAKKYKHVFINVPRVGKLIDVLFNDTPNVTPGYDKDCKTKVLTWQDCVADWESWRKVDWNRQIEKEEECYDYFSSRLGKKYIVVHWRGKNNAGNDMVPMNHDYFINKDIPFVNIDGNWLKSRGYPLHFITDYRMLIEKSQEIHCGS